MCIQPPKFTNKELYDQPRQSRKSLGCSITKLALATSNTSVNRDHAKRLISMYYITSFDPRHKILCYFSVSLSHTPLSLISPSLHSSSPYLPPQFLSPLVSWPHFDGIWWRNGIGCLRSSKLHEPEDPPSPDWGRTRRPAPVWWSLLSKSTSPGTPEL